MATSWNNVGFDITNQTYNVSTQLDKGETWYWRVRATSTTNQIGNWSEPFHFLLPDITTWPIDSNTAAVELRHRQAMPDLNLPNFIDTWVADSGVGATSSQSSSTSFKVGTSNSGENATGLIKIPLTELPNPQAAHISNAVLNLYAQFGSSTDNAISIHPALVPWNESANGTTYDGVNNWSMPGAMGSGDKGLMSDIKQTTSNAWMEFDVTELVQGAFSSGQSHLSLMVVGSIGEGQTTFTSSDGNSNEQPWINLTWSTGTASTPEVAGTNTQPADDEITWDTSTHALLPETNNSLKWSHPNQSNVDDWRIYIWSNYSDERAGWDVYDSRTSAQGWDLANLTWTPPTGLAAGESYEWFVQPITDDILGAKGNETIFHIPENTGFRLNSTDAKIYFQEGQLVDALEYPAIFIDTYIDSGATNSGYVSAQELVVGRSTLTSSMNFETISFLRVNWSSLPIPNSHEFTEASLTLNRLSGGESNQESIRLAVCEIKQEWDQNVTWNSPNGNNQSWIDSPCEVQFAVSTISYDDSTVEIDITYAVQHAHASGSDEVNLGIFVANNTSDDWRFASSDYNADVSKRPKISLNWRTGNQWLPSQPTNLHPTDGSTIWNYSASRPQGANDTTLNWSSSVSNETTWIMQFSTDPNFLDINNTSVFDFSNNGTFSGIWDYANLSYNVENDRKGDFWIYWRVRAEQDHRLGEWSDVNSYRVPVEVGTDDGQGNNTVVLHSGSVFEKTGDLPGVPDATIDSNRPNSALGNNGQLDLGISSSGSGESRIILTFDLSELPFPSTMTPTSVLLSLSRYNVTGTSPLTVGVYACDTFIEDNVTWNTAPTCSNNEVTRSTLFVSPEISDQIWDITSLAQSNIANGNHTLSIMLKTIGSAGSSHLFYDNSNSDKRPELRLNYVDNVDGVIPPAQPVLTFPVDGDVLYNTSSLAT